MIIKHSINDKVMIRNIAVNTAYHSSNTATFVLYRTCYTPATVTLIRWICFYFESFEKKKPIMLLQFLSLTVIDAYISKWARSTLGQ